HSALPSFPTRRSSDLSSPTGPSTFFPRTSLCPPAPYTPTGRVRMPPQAHEKLLSSSRGRSKSTRLASVRTTNGNASAGRPSKPRSEEHTSELQSRENL